MLTLEDRRAFLKLPLEEQRRIMREQAEQFMVACGGEYPMVDDDDGKRYDELEAENAALTAQLAILRSILERTMAGGVSVDEVVFVLADLPEAARQLLARLADAEHRLAQAREAWNGDVTSGRDGVNKGVEDLAWSNMLAEKNHPCFQQMKVALSVTKEDT